MTKTHASKTTCTCGALLGQSHTPGCTRWIEARARDARESGSDAEKQRPDVDLSAIRARLQHAHPITVSLGSTDAGLRDFIEHAYQDMTDLLRLLDESNTYVESITDPDGYPLNGLG